jgi:hypothetical protein
MDHPAQAWIEIRLQAACSVLLCCCYCFLLVRLLVQVLVANR